MLCPFQVNEGKFLALEQDLLPTARVSELCSAVKAISNEAEEDQVMLTSEGKQMDPAEMIGAYSVGTESKPIFVFYRSYLNSPHPPSSPSRLPRRGELKQQLELLNQKPAPSLFQKMVVLAKRLSEYVVGVGELCRQLSEEYQLQYSGWCTALANCDSIVRTYQRHHQLFTKEVETFRSAKPDYLQLLQEFPEKVELLQQLPMPSTLQDHDQNQNPASSLYDWISTHDERNSLLDLSRECKRALSNIDSGSIDSALLATHHIAEVAAKLHNQDEQLHRRNKDLTTTAKKTTELTGTTMALAQNIQSTSERARRYGDAGTIADLVVSHHKSLQMMSDNSSQLEGLAKEAEQSKAALTRFIHAKLQQVAKLQERVAYSNSQLLLLHEHIKLARKRFEVLQQVCHTPQVLAHVLSEVDRRTAFNSALEKRAEEVGVFLKQAREEEKQLRRSFVSNYGQHFISTLFPELVERVPDVSIHLPRSLSKSSQSYHSDLERIRQHLPLEMRPSPASASLQLLSSPLLTSLAVGSSSVFELARAPSSTIDGGEDISKQVKESSVQTGGSLGPSEENLRLEGQLQQLEAVKNELSVTLSTCVGEREQLKRQLEEKDVNNRKVVTLLELDKAKLKQELAQMEGRNRELSNKNDENKKIFSQLESMRESLLVRAEQAEEQTRELTSANRVLEEKVLLVDQEMKTLRQQLSCLSDDKERHTTAMKQKMQEMEALESRYNELSDKYESERTRFQDTITELNRKLSLQDETNSTKLEELQERVSQMESINKESLLQKEAAEAKIVEMKTLSEESKSELERKLDKVSSELLQCRTENDILTGEVRTTNSTLEQREKEIRQLHHKIQEASEQLKTDQEALLRVNRNLDERCNRFEEERSRQELRHQQAQNTISDLKGKLEAAEFKAKDYQNRLEASKKELTSMQNRVQAKEKEIEELRHQITDSLKSSEVEKAKSSQLQETIATLEEKIEKLSLEHKDVEKSQVEKLLALEQKLGEERERYDQVRTKWEEANLIVNELQTRLTSVERQLTEKMAELESVTKERNKEALEFEAELKSLSEERDKYHRQAMEYERDLKELKREIESPQQSLVGSPSVAQSPRVTDTQSLTAALRCITVSVASIKDGDVALFMTDVYGNYLALAFDRIYYLNDGSVQKLNDLSTLVPRLDLKRKILIGKVTGRMHVEVRKEGNRLKVPVGTRMYKIDAEPVLPISHTPKT